MTPNEVTRRDALLIGASGLAAAAVASPAFASFGKQDGKAPASRPKEEYVARDYSGLVGIEGFSKALIENHLTLYSGYVKNTNAAVAALSELGQKNQLGTAAAAELRRRFGWEFNGMRLHELYFENMGGSREPMKPDGPLATALARTFGSLQAWEKDFKAVGAMRGIGWAALVKDGWSGRYFNTWINEHDGGHLGACPIVLIMDVFEHAFMLDYGLKRADYIEAFWKNVNWGAVEKRSG